MVGVHHHLQMDLNQSLQVEIQWVSHLHPALIPLHQLRPSRPLATILAPPMKMMIATAKPIAEQARIMRRTINLTDHQASMIPQQIQTAAIPPLRLASQIRLKMRPAMSLMTTNP